MTSYKRKPKSAIAKCPVHGCKWIRIFFENAVYGMRCEGRAEVALNTHIRRSHKPKVLINGR